MLWLRLVAMEGNIVDASYNGNIDLTKSNNPMKFFKQNVKSSSEVNAVNCNFSDTGNKYPVLIGWGNVFGFIVEIYEPYKIVSSNSKNLEICLVSLHAYSIEIFMWFTRLPCYILFFVFFSRFPPCPKTPLNNCINYS